MGKYKEFWLIQLSANKGRYSDIRVMKPSDCDELERLDLPPGHDNINYNEVVPVIEKQALAEKDALIDLAIEGFKKCEEIAIDLHENNALLSKYSQHKADEMCKFVEQTLSKLKEARKQFDQG